MKKRRSTAQVASRSALVISNLTKVAGLAVAIHAGFTTTPDTRVLALAAFMMAGAQISETAVLSAIDRFLGKPPPKDD